MTEGAPLAAGMAGVSPPPGRQLGPLPQALARRHRRGPLPPHRYPAPVPWRSPSLRTRVTAPARAAGPSSSRRASCRRAKITVKDARCARVSDSKAA
jgi:hypothetical protein